MSATPSHPDYDRGIKDASRHRERTEDTWVRRAFGPIVWLGVPLLIAYVYMKRTNPMGGAKGSANPFQDMMEQMMPIKKRQFRIDVKGTKFGDVIGIPEAKAEVRQYVDFLVEPEKFTRLGARLPKGCLLTGEPGTGKTLLAKAVAGEAEVPFFSCNGADFIELMGGSGPKRVRELFEEARKSAPAIIFIDEIDAIGSRAGKQGGSVSSEENRTINQLLAELDGLSTAADPIVVMAATNFQDNIDKALLREGRFDRKVNIDMPDKEARVDIFKHYLDKVGTGDPEGRQKDEEGVQLPVDKNISNGVLSNELANLTPGLSPATIATVVNEAALQSGIKGKPLVGKDELLEAIDNTLIGRKHRNRQSTSSLERTAIHESGHTIAGWMLPSIKTVLKVSVTPRGNAMGYTQRAGSEFHEYQTNATLFADIVVMLGGRTAEEVMLGNASAGAMDDLQRATDMAIKQQLAFGMSGNTGLLAYNPEMTTAGREWVTFSDEAQFRAEMQAKDLVQAAHAMATSIVKANKDKLELLVKELVEKKELLTGDLEKILGNRPSTPTIPELTEKVNAVMGKL